MTITSCPPDCGHVRDGYLSYEARRVRMDDLLVDLPDVYDEQAQIRIERDVITSRDALTGAISSGVGAGRGPREGDRYTRFTRHGVLWMSDTMAERRDHLGVAERIREAGLGLLHPDAELPWTWGDRRPRNGHVLIGGLGLGMITGFALRQPGIRRVDVVEVSPDVVRVVGPLYQAVARETGVELVIHEADMMTKTWPAGTWWDVAWFDIWPTLCTDDLAEHGTLARKYTRRTGWYASWAHETLLYHRERENRWSW
jgi:hypothetical protein